MLNTQARGQLYKSYLAFACASGCNDKLDFYFQSSMIDLVLPRIAYITHLYAQGAQVAT